MRLNLSMMSISKEIAFSRYWPSHAQGRQPYPQEHLSHTLDLYEFTELSPALTNPPAVVTHKGLFLPILQ